ncbi:MAG: glycerol-3-phosphate cytidylyltransferase [Deltaproteobacteria bacterium GWC2_55_46]|nr:MAG: glycerol-3-phosphate cytidylyltransferase [Deltaproteobacteria bacterium GWA2_55_82]OGQ64093.1 MAG: glycerol-3-phosphate cytidylyltransferase [Deltaproteobacteria bacterium RIFCSPLOWO2_02_FULL_55_12]OIJ74546.1 MAG: glycerol-3-phosphate cytidylyltransferase [Deltaproteobacteria bacterium GWC2_55_46]HCY10728.1 D-glycero-beta-D-manno-heptose 1-phosphate adenylyltransferase [Deltaproteobacteria bacterium]
MGKVISLKGLMPELKALRKKKKKVVFTNGCFDILHAGHVRYLKKARSLGDILVVGLNSDSSVRSIKGDQRPIVPGKERSEVLSALECVDYVVVFNDSTPVKLIEAIRPDVLAKGADWAAKEIVGGESVRKNGGKVARITLLKGRSTTNIIRRILELHKGRGQG